MSKVYFNLAGGNFFQDWTNAGLITANDVWSGVDSIEGFLGDIDAGSPTNVNPQTVLGAGLGALDVNANQTNPNTFATGGVAEFAIANPTIALNGSGTADAPSIVLYLDATGRQNIVVSALIRDIDGSADNTNQQIAVQYRIGGVGPWTNLPAGYIADASVGPSLTGSIPLSVTLPPIVNGQPLLEVRFLTTNAPSNDEWIGIDDISVTSDAGGGGDVIAPELAAFNPTDPDDGAFAVQPSQSIVLRFTEPVFAGTGQIVITNGAGDTRTIAANDAQVTILGAQVTINPTADLLADQTYHVTVTGDAFTDAAGNPFAGIGAGGLDFTTYDPTATIAIYTLQGAGHRSAYEGAPVITTGVVTAVDSNGFYLQDPTGDGNDATSDGIFVFTSSAPTVSVGQSIRVQGTVQEFLAGGDPKGLTVTEIVSPTVTLLGSGAVAATLIGTGGRTPPSAVYEDDGFTSFDPASDALDFYESLEGMVVTIQSAQAVSVTNSFGETYVVASQGAGATGMNGRGGITLSSGDFNPERIQIDDDSGLFAGCVPGHTQGDLLGDVTGVVGYSFNSYEVLVTQAVTVQSNVTLARETSAIEGDDDHLTIASFNVENLDPTDGAAKFNAIASIVVSSLNGPDIIGLQEIQDADGAGNGADLSGAATAQKLIDAIVAAGGPRYVYVEVAPAGPNQTGGEPGGNIRNGFLYNPERVDYVAGSAHLVEDAAYNGTRRPLVADFIYEAQLLTAVSVHSTSRGGSDPFFGSTQPPVQLGDAARTAQATALRSYLETYAPGSNIAVVGDFNGYYFEAALQAGGLVSNLYDLLPVNERYSYMFEGNAQPFDNILVSQSLLDGAAFDAVHTNSELRPTEQAATDHDQVLASLYIQQAPDLHLEGNNKDNTLTGGWGDDHIEGDNGDDTLSGGRGDDRLEGDSGDDVLNGDLGEDDLNGDTGDDVLNGGWGNDRLDGEKGDDRVDGGDGADTVLGGSGDDTLLGGAGNDRLDGDTGNDKLTGGAGSDVLIGGSGNDSFIFLSLADFGVGVLDQIQGLASSDRIDLAAIDANSIAVGNQAFSYVGTGAFTGVAGQLHRLTVSGGWQVEGDVNGDGVADFAFLVGGSAPAASNFIL